MSFFPVVQLLAVRNEHRTTIKAKMFDLLVENSVKSTENSSANIGENTISCTLVFDQHIRFKEEAENVWDDTTSRRPFTNGTMVNVKRVK